MQTLFVCGMLLLLGALAVQLWTQSTGPSGYRSQLRLTTMRIANTEVTSATGTVAATNVITGLSLIADALSPGMLVTGAGFPPGARLTIVNNTLGTATASLATTVTGAFPLVFSDDEYQGLVHLFKAPFAGGGDPTPASFTEADFTGYSSQNIQGTPVYSNSDGSAESDCGDLSWVLTSTPATGNVIYGYWVDYIDPIDSVTNQVLLWESFPTPMPMNAAGNAIVLSIPLKLPGPGAATLP